MLLAEGISCAKSGTARDVGVREQQGGQVEGADVLRREGRWSRGAWDAGGRASEARQPVTWAFALGTQRNPQRVLTWERWGLLCVSNVPLPSQEALTGIRERQGLTRVVSCSLILHIHCKNERMEFSVDSDPELRQSQWGTLLGTRKVMKVFRKGAEQSRQELEKENPSCMILDDQPVSQPAYTTAGPHFTHLIPRPGEHRQSQACRCLASMDMRLSDPVHSAVPMWVSTALCWPLSHIGHYLLSVLTFYLLLRLFS